MRLTTLLVSVVDENPVISLKTLLSLKVTDKPRRTDTGSGVGIQNIDICSVFHKFFYTRFSFFSYYVYFSYAYCGCGTVKCAGFDGKQMFAHLFQDKASRKDDFYPFIIPIHLLNWS